MSHLSTYREKSIVTHVRVRDLFQCEFSLATSSDTWSTILEPQICKLNINCYGTGVPHEQIAEDILP